MLAAQVVGLSKANWIHVEEYLPGPKLTPPPPEPELDIPDEMEILDERPL